LQHLLAGTLNIGVTYTFSPILTETLITFMKMYPQVKLNIFYEPMNILMRMLGKRELDFVLAFKPTTHYDDIESHVLFGNRLAAVVQTNHPLAQRDMVSLSELAHYDIALPSKGLQARNAFDRLTSSFQGRLNVRIELNEVNILLKLIRQTNMVTILSEATIHNESGVKAVSLDMSDNGMEGCVHVPKNVYRKCSAQEFLRLLSESNAIRERLRDWL